MRLQKKKRWGAFYVLLNAFGLFQDESLLIWYSGKEERQLKLNTVTKIIPGQRTVSFYNQIVFL